MLFVTVDCGFRRVTCYHAGGTDPLIIGADAGLQSLLVTRVMGSRAQNPLGDWVIGEWGAGTHSDGRYAIADNTRAAPNIALTIDYNSLRVRIPHGLTAAGAELDATVPWNPTWALICWQHAYFGADINVIGNYVPSDRRLKTDIAPLARGLDEIMRLQPVRFRHNSRIVPRADSELHFGLVADDVALVMPELVRLRTLPDHGDEEFRVLDTGTLPYVLINAVKTLAERVAALEAK